jgi:WD40 repeat protein
MHPKNSNPGLTALIQSGSFARDQRRGVSPAAIAVVALICWLGARVNGAPLPPDIHWKSNLHSGFVNAVAVSPDGALLASASGDTTIKLWRLADGSVLRTLTGHADFVNAVAFSPDGATLASGSADTTVKLWRVADGAPLRTLFGHTEFVSSVAFSPDGLNLLSGSGDASLRLWRVANGALLRTSFGHISTIWSVDFSPDGTLVASGSGSFFDAPGAGENTTKLWRVSDGATVRTLQGHGADVWSVKFSPDGTLLATGSGDETIKLWRVSDGAPVRTLTGHSAEVLSVAFAPDGLTLASGSRHPDNTLNFWRVSDGAPLRSYNQETYFINSIAFAPNGLWFGYGRDDNYVVVARNPFPPTGPPRLLLQPQDRTVPCYTNVLLRTAATGVPPLSFQWSRNGTNLASATNAYLSLDHLREPNAGEYRVAVTNALGTALSAAAMITVVDTDPAVSLRTVLLGSKLAVSWPNTCADYGLEESAEMGPRENWTDVPTPPVFVDGRFVIELPFDGAGRFFRLRKLQAGTMQ